MKQRPARPAACCRFHGLPRRTLDRGDPYHCQCQKTARLLADELGLDAKQWTLAFQSRFGRAEWLKPYTADTLRALGQEGVARVDVVCPGFVSDCLETLEEIGIEVQAGVPAAPAARSSTRFPASTSIRPGSPRWPTSPGATCRAGSRRRRTPAARELTLLRAKALGARRLRHAARRPALDPRQSLDRGTHDRAPARAVAPSADRVEIRRVGPIVPRVPSTPDDRCTEFRCPPNARPDASQRRKLATADDARRRSPATRRRPTSSARRRRRSRARHRRAAAEGRSRGRRAAATPGFARAPTSRTCASRRRRRREGAQVRDRALRRASCCR